LADHWNGSGNRGAYVALPTQATANQLHERVRRFLKRAFPERDLNLLLVHGAAPLREDLEFLPSNIDEEHGDVAAGSWFVQSKRRSLIAQYGVGTVDQALMAVLLVKHVFVRLLGLAGKAVVIDEVH